MEIKNSSESDVESIGLKLNENLSKLLERNNVSLSQLHRNTGVATPTIKRLQSDPSTNPTISTLIPIAKFFNITVAQLIGTEPLFIDTNGFIENKANWLKVPIISWEEISHFNSNSLHDSNHSFVSVDIEVGNKPYAIKVIEDDWLALSKDSILIINSMIKPEHKDFAIVEKIDHGLPTLKQIIIDQDKTYLKSMNPQFAPSLFDETCVFHGVLMQIRKDTKT